MGKEEEKNKEQQKNTWTSSRNEKDLTPFIHHKKEEYRKNTIVSQLKMLPCVPFIGFLIILGAQLRVFWL